ncbi:DUF3987 domain-containing protein [Psychrobacter sp. HD31]|uniref:DUF3987 domain-containing protein n=1 Tax=Psychrobacter sp. HD31 TaxID=3112003 RepID=UPI003DA58214
MNTQTDKTKQSTTKGGNEPPANEPSLNQNPAQQLIRLFENNRATNDVISQYHEPLAHLPASAIISGNILLTKEGFTKGDNGNINCINHLLLPLVNSDLQPTNTAMIPPIDDKGIQGKTIFEPIIHPQGAFIIGSSFTTDNKVYLVADLQAGLNLYKLDSTATIMVCFTPANLAYVAKQWQFKAKGRLIAPIGIHELSDYKTLLTNTNVAIYALEFAIDWEIDNTEVIRLMDNADIHRMNIANTSTTLSDDEKKQLSWDEINKSEPFTLLINERGEPNRYPLDAFPPLAKNAVSAIAQHSQASIAMAGHTVLGAMAYLAQNHVNARSFQHQYGEPCSLFIMIEGDSGDRKSSCINKANLRIVEHDKKEYNQYLDRLEEHNKALAQCKGNKAKEEYEQKYPKPLNPKAIYSDFTIDSLVGSYIHEHLKSAYITGGEASKVFGSYSFSADNQGSTLSICTETWDGEPVARHRSRSNANGSGVAYDVRLCINMLGQKVALEKVLNDKMMMEQGFLCRFLFTAPDTLAGKRTHTADTWKNNREFYKDKRLVEYWRRCQFLLDKIPPQSIDGRIERPVIPLTDEADTLAMNFYNDIEKKVGRAGKFVHLKSFAGRALPNAIRIATVLAFFEGSEAITPELMVSGIKLAEHSLMEWERYGGYTDFDEKLVQADRVENWLINYCRENNITIVPRVKLQQGITPTSLRKKKKLDPLIKILKDNNHIREIKHDNKASIELNPKVFTDK